jgi:hypothetical protein
MNLDQLVDAARFVREGPSVPDWTLGCFRRQSITYFTGQVDTTTQVIWLQARGLSFDLRVNLRRRDLVEGGLAASRWDGDQMRWDDWISFQPQARWPEPGRLTRVGNCLIEFAPSGAYVEDWRAQLRNTDLLVGLRLQQERVLGTGQIRHRGGGLIVCGAAAGLVRGPAGEVSYALRENPDPGFVIRLSTQSGNEGRPLVLDGFEYAADDAQVIQRLEEDGVTLERTFTVDTLERLRLPYGTEPQPEGAAWFERERAMLLPDVPPELLP